MKHNPLEPRFKMARFRHLGKVRRSFTRKQLNAKVGWVDAHELHRLDCPDYQLAHVELRAIRVGSLDRVFVALVDDYIDGHCDFPALHDCLRSETR